MVQVNNRRPPGRPPSFFFEKKRSTTSSRQCNGRVSQTTAKPTTPFDSTNQNDVAVSCLCRPLFILIGQAASPQLHLVTIVAWAAISFTTMSRATRRRAPVAAPVPCRFDALVDMGNPMRGINIFPYLRRRVEGRALGAIGPAAVLELSRTAREAAMPRRWPREVFRGFLFSFACCCCDKGR
jgi:hypothetical protein